MAGDDDLPRLLGGRYRLEATLGRGGMGVVYRAVDLVMERGVAVKLIRSAFGAPLDDEIAGRFLREAKHTARLQHEHVVEVFDLGRTDDGALYFVMELLDGESLSARLRRHGKLSPVVTVHIGRQICSALQGAHALGVVHRDLKPANVMLLSRAGDDDYVKVLDFGVAKSYAPDQETQLTHTGMLVGTVEYMAPEQMTGRPVDGRTDIYALGVVLYRMLSGKPPFADTGVPALIHAHLNTLPKPLAEVTSGVPDALDRIVLRCLAKSPERRFDSMAELARALRSALSPEQEVVVELEDERAIDPYVTTDPTLARSLHEPPPPEDPTISDDATLKMARPTPSSPDRAMRSSWVEPRWCAMCQTLNAPHLRTCAACGVSLSSEEQAAVRARVHASVPGAGPSTPLPGALTAHRTPSVPSWRANASAEGWLPHPASPPPGPPSVWQRFLSWTGLRRR